MGDKAPDGERAPGGTGTPGGTGLPASVELAWGVREPAARGPRRGLSLERIVEAGVRVAGAEGLGAVSMSRVAAELGASTMSLYRYVAAKDELLLLMVDTALGRPPEEGAPGQGWRAGLRRWAEGVRAAYYRHPWALKVPISGPPVGPNNVAWLENALAGLEATALDEGQKLSVVLLVSGFVRNEATLTTDIMAAVADNQVMPAYGRTLARLTDPARFPAIHRAIASGALDDDDDMDVEFEFGLERILDGVAKLVEEQAAQSMPGRPAVHSGSAET